MAKKRKKDKPDSLNLREKLLSQIEPLIPEVREQYEQIKTGRFVPSLTNHGLLMKILVENTHSFEEFLGKVLELTMFINNPRVNKLNYTPAPPGIKCTCGYKAVAVLGESRGGAPYIHKHMCPIGLLIAFLTQYTRSTIYVARKEEYEKAVEKGRRGRRRASKSEDAIVVGKYVITRRRVPHAIPVVIVSGNRPPEEELFV